MARRRRGITNERDTARVWGLDDMVPEVMAEAEHQADLVGNLTAAQHAVLDHTGIPGVGGGGGSIVWTPKYAGIVPQGLGLTTIGNASPGHGYIMYALVSNSGTLFVPGDELVPKLLMVRGSSATVEKFALPGTWGSAVVVNSIVALEPTSSLVISAIGSFGDQCWCRLSAADGSIQVTHVDNGNNTNGLYVVWES